MGSRAILLRLKCRFDEGLGPRGRRHSQRLSDASGGDLAGYQPTDFHGIEGSPAHPGIATPPASRIHGVPSIGEGNTQRVMEKSNLNAEGAPGTIQVWLGL